jgi:predicted AlkP superfamily phosphohydrolase/phosphomutase
MRGLIVRRAVVLGVSGFNQDLVNSWIGKLPVLKKMREDGVWGRIVSTIPPSSPHAWVSSLSGRNPGAFGVLGARYRSDYSYSLQKKADSGTFEDRVRPLYRILSRLGQRVGAVNLPWTHPVPEIPGGFCVGRGVPGSLDETGIWPREFTGEIKKVVGDYIQHIPLSGNRRSALDKKFVLNNIRNMDDQRFKLVKYLMEEKLCDIVMAVIDGVETISHLYLRDADSKHRFHDPESKERETLYDYYRFIDEWVGKIRDTLDDDTVICVYSVSAVQRLDGIINLNEWLLEKGYLSVKEYPAAPASVEELDVDWSETKAWAMGETGQIYINLKGREEYGIVEPGDYTLVIEQLKKDIEGLTVEKGQPLSVEVYRGDELYFGDFAKYVPDMLVHIEKGRWRTDQRVGFGVGKIFGTEELEEEITEGCGRFGYLGIAGSDFPAAGEVEPVSLLDVAPTVVDIMNLRAPYNTMDYEMEGYSLLMALRDSVDEEKADDAVDKEAREEKIRSRLKALGY